MNEANDSKFAARKWNIVNVYSKLNYFVGHENIYNKELLKSNLCYYNDPYVLVIVDITSIGHQVTQVAFKNFAPCTRCITKTFGTTIDDAEKLDLVITIYNLIEYSSIYSKTTGLWFYYKDEATSFNADITNNDNFKSFK